VFPSKRLIKKTIGILLLLFLSSSIFGQDDDIEKIIMKKRALTCDDIFFNVTSIIPEMYQRGSIDSLNAVVDFWKNECDKTESLQRVRIVLAIKNNTFSEDLYYKDIFDLLIQYKAAAANIFNDKEMLDGDIPKNYYVGNNVYNYRALFFFTQDLSKTILLTRNDLNPLEKFFLEFYTNKIQSFTILESPEFKGYKIYVYYNYNKSINRQPEIRKKYVLR
jgi:hypothetical protein